VEREPSALHSWTANVYIYIYIYINILRPCTVGEPKKKITRHTERETHRESHRHTIAAVKRSVLVSPCRSIPARTYIYLFICPSIRSIPTRMYARAHTHTAHGPGNTRKQTRSADIENTFYIERTQTSKRLQPKK